MPAPPLPPSPPAAPAAACPVCGSHRFRVFFEHQALPIHCNLLWGDRHAARTCPRGDLRLAVCPRCELIWNLAFDEAALAYSPDYENSLHFSPRFQQYARSLAVRLVERHGLRRKRVLEIGCGKGDFLVLLCELGENDGIGFDPSYAGAAEPPLARGRVRFIRDYYSERYAAVGGDLICCRHALEHVADPTKLLAAVRRAIGDRSGTVVFFEVPNGLHTFRRLAIWDVIYEHCTYFTPASLSYAFTACGFEVTELREAFDGQFLGLEARPAAPRSSVAGADEGEVATLAAELGGFDAYFRRTVKRWREHLDGLRAAGRRAVVWGAGSKGVTWLNLLHAGDEIAYVVDINPRKQGAYVAGTGHQIVGPDALGSVPPVPDVILITNPVYRAEIQALATSAGWAGKLVCV